MGSSKTTPVVDRQHASETYVQLQGQVIPDKSEVGEVLFGVAAISTVSLPSMRQRPRQFVMKVRAAAATAAMSGIG